MTHTQTPEEWAKEHDARTRLEVSAPDLLEALKQVDLLLGQIRISTTLTALGRDNGLAKKKAALAITRAAIAKAEGE